MFPTVLCWKWTQANQRIAFTSEQVNAWADAVLKNTTIPVRVACVTDEPEGIADHIDIIKPPHEFDNIKTPWTNRTQTPKCYRRLTMFRPDAAEIFGAEKIICMDIDVLIVGNIDHIINRDADCCFVNGSSPLKRRYNGGLVMVKAGSRPEVYNQFTQDGAVESGKKFVGSDQAWYNHILSQDEQTYGPEDGVYFFGSNFKAKYRKYPPENICILLFPGSVKGFHNMLWNFTAATERILDKVLTMKNVVIPGRAPKNETITGVRNYKIIRRCTLGQKGDVVAFSTTRAQLLRAKGIIGEPLPGRGPGILKDQEEIDNESPSVEIIKK